MKQIFITLAAAVLISVRAMAGTPDLPVSQERMLERFLSYVNIDSQSVPAAMPDEFPMTEGQARLAAFIAEEIRSFSDGVECTVSADNYVYVTIPSNVKDSLPSLGFSCHLDVTPECESSPVRPSVIRRYDGSDIFLGEGRWLRTESPEGQDLKNCIGKTIIHTDGTTLLGADDKCGCSIAVSLIESIIRDNDIRHGDLQFVICPNEDVGLSAERIDTAIFNPDILFDIDGLGTGAITSSNFTASQLIVRFYGHDVHPGNAKALKYGDALAAACHFISAFPPETRPERSEGLQGYIHPWSLKDEGNGQWTVSVRVRYFGKGEGAYLSTLLASAFKSVMQAFPHVRPVILSSGIQYENVAYSMHPASSDIVTGASEKTGIPVHFTSERGGTTAAMFAAKGMTGGMCLFSGQHAVHSVYEYAVLEEMYDSYRLALAIIEETAKLGK